jgi:hypothetical protein
MADPARNNFVAQAWRSECGPRFSDSMPSLFIRFETTFQMHGAVIGR